VARRDSDWQRHGAGRVYRVNVKDMNTNYGGINMAVPSDPVLGYRQAVVAALK
jgi:hypothetical protein